MKDGVTPREPFVRRRAPTSHEVSVPNRGRLFALAVRVAWCCDGNVNLA